MSDGARSILVTLLVVANGLTWWGLTHLPRAGTPTAAATVGGSPASVESTRLAGIRELRSRAQRDAIAAGRDTYTFETTSGPPCGGR